MNLFNKPEARTEDAPILKLPYHEHHCAATLGRYLHQAFSEIPAIQDIVFVCIGTDRSTGDALGPLVGSRLKKYNFSDIFTYGTLDHPVHAMNLSETLRQIQDEHDSPFIVGIDACLGQANSVGCLQLGKGPLKPGAGVKKELPEVGDIHLTGVVNVGGFMEYFVLQNTRLSLVVNMAEVIAKGIYISLIQSRRLPVFAPRELKLPDFQPLEQ